jgi:hypothetical protein
MRTEVHDLLVENIKVGSALDIPYGDQEFDIVFSHGVLHHIPEISRAQAEIRRVLKPTGSLVMMVYAKHSLNYQVSIRIIRRLGLVLLMLVPGKLPDIYEKHRQNARKAGLGSDPLPVQISSLINPRLSARSNHGERNSVIVEDGGRPLVEFGCDGMLEPNIAFGDRDTGRGWVSRSFGRLEAAHQILFEGLLPKTSIVEIIPLC